MPIPAVARPRRLDTLVRSAIGKPKPSIQRAISKDQCCEHPQIEDDGDMKACMTCGKLIEESNIVADVTFSEDSRGAATVQGGFVGENARHARTLNTTALRRLGGSERNTFAEIESNGRRVLSALCPSLNISELVQNQAANIWGLAAKNNFNAGRKTDEVVASCLYAACRRQPNNDKLMIDISEKINTGPFRLGAVYKDLCQTLYLGGDEITGQYQVEIEPLIMKYCRQLEFGDKTRQVAEDSIQIVRRMDRDWMTSGRHPAGLCGACIILAARMNNFRRSVREVVWVAKVADVTIMKRIEEFRRTKSAAMTVEDFRKFGARLKYQHDPPSFHADEIRKQKLEQKRQKRQERLSAGLDSSDAISITSSRSPSATPLPEVAGSGPSVITGKRIRPVTEQESVVVEDDRPSDITRPPLDPNLDPMLQSGQESPRKRARNTSEPPPSSEEQPVRLDADGFAIPALPDPPKEMKRRPGRPKTVAAPEPLKFTLEELMTEEELQEEIERNLSDDPVMQTIESEIERAEQIAKATSEQQKRLEAEQASARRIAEGLAHANAHENDSREMVTAEELEAEFADDDEVNNCILNDDESRVKEQIWVSHNEAWLRSQYEKELIKRIEEARGNKQKGKKGSKGKKKRAKMGDGTLLNEATTPIDSPADAARAMLDKHADRNFSKFVDYDVIERIFGDGRSTSSISRASSTSRSSTPAARSERVPSASPAPATVNGNGTGQEATDTAAEEDPADEGEDGAVSPVASQWAEDYYEEGTEAGDDDDYTAALDTMGGASFDDFEEDYNDDAY